MVPDTLIPFLIFAIPLFIFMAWLKLSDRDETPDTHAEPPRNKR